MKKPPKKPKQISYKYEIGYSQGRIVVDVVIGLFFIIVFGISSKWWMGNVWWLIIWIAIGTFILWGAIKRAKNQGPQIKISYAGIWTKKTGLLSWHRISLQIRQFTTYRSVSYSLVISNRVSGIELISFNTGDLDMNLVELRKIASEFSSTLA
ncbi:hypothetical protein [Hymenobacter roseosalivarius]|uniref:hypothetical protein n=1 Tax=Hymenobacter roseosalivarius TaxID=89967 RepID=UPI000A077ABB|nr:hypothetical protein [Hymenobacter roseosalivarius]